MKARWLGAMYAALCLGVSFWSVMHNYHARWVLTRSPEAVRSALIASDQLAMNEVFRGCGVGRDHTHEPRRFVDGLARTNPDILRQFLRDPDPTVRAGAALALGRSTDPLSVEPIIEIVENDVIPKVRATAAGALSHYRDPEIHAEIARLTKSRDTLTRVCAFYALEKEVTGRDADWLEEVSGEEASDQVTRIAQNLAFQVLTRPAEK